MWTERDGFYHGEKTYYQYSLEGSVARILPLVHAITKYHPPQIFNYLVYHYSHKKDENLLRIIGNYPKKKCNALSEKAFRKEG